MFPPANLDPQSTRWKTKVEQSIEAAEKAQPNLDKELHALQRENNSVLSQVTSRVNSYYTNTYASYPAYQRTVAMETVFGAPTRTFNISAPVSADNTVAETWVTALSYSLPLAFPVTEAGIRLNSAQFGLQGPNAYVLRFRWRIGGTAIEGINTTPWMSRHQFNLTEYGMNTPPVVTNVSNRYALWSGASTSLLTVELQASIQNPSNRTAAVASQSITLSSVNNENNPTYLDVMVTV